MLISDLRLNCRLLNRQSEVCHLQFQESLPVLSKLDRRAIHTELTESQIDLRGLSLRDKLGRRYAASSFVREAKKL
jgi:hypothetical protein